MSDTPIIQTLRAIPVAGRDSMLMNLSGAHGPFFTRNLLVLTDSAGNTGVALTFITPREFRQLKLIERSVKTKIIRGQLPTDANVLEKQREQIISKMQSILEQNQYHDYLPIAEALENDYDIHDIAAAAIKFMQEGNKALEEPQTADALPEALALVKSGAMAGTVLNDANNQAKATFDLAKNLADGKGAADGTNWKIDNKIVRVPYVGVDQSNLAEFIGK